MGKTFKDQEIRDGLKHRKIGSKNLKMAMKNKRHKLKQFDDPISQPSVINKLRGNPWDWD